MEINVDKRLIKRSDNSKLDLIGPTNVTGDLTVTGDLAVTGDNTLTGDNTFVGDQAVTGDLDVTGAVGVTQAAANTGSETRLAYKEVEFEIVGGGITETLTGAIPANAYVLGVQAKIKVTITTTTLASFDIGVTGDTDRLGACSALTKNTASTPAAAQGEAVGLGRYYNVATDILLTGDAGTFTAGTIVVGIHYIDLSPPDNFA